MRFSHYWAHRHDGVELIVDRLVTYNLSAFAAYGLARVGLTPNQVSLTSGLMAFAAFIFGVLLPTDPVPLSLLFIFGASQLSYVLDCADGQIARATGATSKYGDFFDKSIDIVAGTLMFGGFFAYLYRVLVEAGDSHAATTWLLLGFFFLMVRTARFSVWQRLEAEHNIDLTASVSSEGIAVIALKNFMDMQVSLFGMLLFPYAPKLTFALFAIQTVILTAVYVRYFARAKELFRE